MKGSIITYNYIACFCYYIIITHYYGHYIFVTEQLADGLR
jgi:hypothetical protein